jgi:hypothetical protein
MESQQSADKIDNHAIQLGQRDTSQNGKEIFLI